MEEAKDLISSLPRIAGPLLHSKLSKLWNLSNNLTNRMWLCDPHFHLLSTLKDLLIQHHNDVVVLNNVTGILWYLSRTDSCCFLIASPQYHLLPLLTELLFQSPGMYHNYRNHIINLYSNLFLQEDLHDPLFQSSSSSSSSTSSSSTSPQNHQINNNNHGTNLFEFLQQEIILRPQYAQLYKLISNCIHYLPNDGIIHQQYMISFIQSTLHVICFLQLIHSGSNPCLWEHRFTGGIANCCLNFLVRFSFSIIGQQELKKFPFQYFFYEMITSKQRVEGMKATIVLIQTYATDSRDHDGDDDLVKGLFWKFPYLYEIFLESLSASIEYDIFQGYGPSLDADGFRFGIIQLKEMTRALTLLASDPINRLIMRQELDRIVALCCRILWDFIENRSEYCYYVNLGKLTSGGGGKDVITMGNVLELLLQVFSPSSFAKEDESRGIEKEEDESAFSVERFVRLWDLVENIIDLPVERNISKEIRQIAVCLLERLSQYESVRWGIQRNQGDRK